MLETDTTEIHIIIHSIYENILPEMEPSNFAFGIITTDHQAIRNLNIHVSLFKICAVKWSYKPQPLTSGFAQYFHSVGFDRMSAKLKIG